MHSALSFCFDKDGSPHAVALDLVTYPPSQAALDALLREQGFVGPFIHFMLNGHHESPVAKMLTVVKRAMNHPISHPEERARLAAEFAKTRASRILRDAENCTSYMEEYVSLLLRACHEPDLDYCDIEYLRALVAAEHEALRNEENAADPNQKGAT